MTIAFEPLTAENAAEFYALECASFVDPWRLEDFLYESQNNAAVYVLARTDGTAAGFFGRIDVCGEGQITNVCVAPEFRRHGIGAALMKYAAEDAAERGLERMTLEVRASNAAAMALYERFGFYRIGERKNYYSNPKENAVLMDLEIG